MRSTCRVIIHILMSKSESSPSSDGSDRPGRMTEVEWFEDRESPGYGNSDEADARADIGEGDEWGLHHDFQGGTNKHEWLAFKILKQTGRALCSTTLFRPPDRGLGEWGDAFSLVMDGEPVDHDPAAMHHENHELELSDPTLRIPKTASARYGETDYGVFRTRRRHTETGYISGGESTGIVIADRPLPAFMNVVETVLLLREAHLSERQLRDLREWAAELKRGADETRDTDILAKILAATEAAPAADS